MSQHRHRRVAAAAVRRWKVHFYPTPLLKRRSGTPTAKKNNRRMINRTYQLEPEISNIDYESEQVKPEDEGENNHKNIVDLNTEISDHDDNNKNNQKVENIDNQELGNEDNEEVQNGDNEEIENKDPVLENKDNKDLENVGKQNVEKENNQELENEDNRDVENGDQKNNYVGNVEHRRKADYKNYRDDSRDIKTEVKIEVKLGDTLVDGHRKDKIKGDQEVIYVDNFYKNLENSDHHTPFHYQSRKHRTNNYYPLTYSRPKNGNYANDKFYVGTHRNTHDPEDSDDNIFDILGVSDDPIRSQRNGIYKELLSNSNLRLFDVPIRNEPKEPTERTNEGNLYYIYTITSERPKENKYIPYASFSDTNEDDIVVIPQNESPIQRYDDYQKSQFPQSKQTHPLTVTLKSLRLDRLPEKSHIGKIIPKINFQNKLKKVFDADKDNWEPISLTTRREPGNVVTFDTPAIIENKNNVIIDLMPKMADERKAIKLTNNIQTRKLISDQHIKKQNEFSSIQHIDNIFNRNGAIQKTSTYSSLKEQNTVNEISMSHATEANNKIIGSLSVNKTIHSVVTVTTGKFINNIDKVNSFPKPPLAVLSRVKEETSNLEALKKDNKDPFLTRISKKPSNSVQHIDIEHKYFLP